MGVGVRLSSCQEWGKTHHHRTLCTRLRREVQDFPIQSYHEDEHASQSYFGYHLYIPRQSLNRNIKMGVSLVLEDSQGEGDRHQRRQLGGSKGKSQVLDPRGSGKCRNPTSKIPLCYRLYNTSYTPPPAHPCCNNVRNCRVNSRRIVM